MVMANNSACIIVVARQLTVHVIVAHAIDMLEQLAIVALTFAG